MPEKVPESEREGEVLGFIREALEEGEAFLKSQKGYNKIQETISSIMGGQQELRSSSLSSATSNRTGKIASDLAALLTDIRPFWEYRTYNPKFEQTQVTLGKRASAWYTQRQIDQRFGDVIKYALVGGSSYAHIYQDEDIDDQNLMAEDPRDVFPIRPNGNESVQNAFGVIVRREYPVNYLRRKYPKKADQIAPDRDGSLSHDMAGTRAGRLFENLVPSPFRDRLFGKDPVRQIPKIPTADAYTLFLKDGSRNLKSYPVQMGDFDESGRALNNWSYIVEPGDQLYPRGRMILTTRSAILNDGPNIYWHGLFPLPKLTLDPWPWSWLGKAVLWDLLPLQASFDKVLRIIEDHMDQIARPGVIGDKNSVSEATLNRLDTRKAGFKLRQNPLAGKGIQIIYPNPLPPDVFNHRDFLTNEMDFISGVRDMSQMMRLNQLPSADSMEKLMESMTASVRGRSRVIEAFMREMAMIVAYNFAQFDTLAKRLAILGPQSITPEDFDYDPNTMVPDYVHSKDFDSRGIPTEEALMRGPLPRYERAQEWMRQFTFHVAPGSLLSASEVEKKLLYMNLARAGIVDVWSLWEVLGIPNAGNPPDGAHTITERLQAQQQLGVGMNASPAGRKQSGETMPRVVTKTSQ